ncbi:MAG: polyprenyl synthetase family protein [Phycisphaerales bacterium]|nr:polyprenyl synthetase family protein [Phycisphaerales bacterium]
MSLPRPISGNELKSFLKNAAERVDLYLKEYVQSLKESPAKLSEAVVYSLLGPGKRIRPALVLLCHDAVGGGGGTDAGVAMPAAAAIEMIHCFSLIHDDLPAMDDDDLRRGRPTNHKVYGEALAILAGDALNTMAFELIAKEMKDPVLAVAILKELAFATGPEGMIGGQVLDTCHPEEAKSNAGPPPAAALPKLQQIHRMKTGALIRCACRMGALCGGASAQSLTAIDTYGRAIGLAFQIVDDILDVTATAEQMGKATGKDADKGKLTYPSLVGLEKSREFLGEQVKIADRVSAELGVKAALLGELAHELASRTH